MDRRSWLWRRKSSEKSPGETESSGGSVSSHSERFSDDQIYSQRSSLSPEVTSSKVEMSLEEVEVSVSGDVKTLSEKLSAALINISIKEDLVKQHSKVAEEAVEGWEKAENEVLGLRKQIEVLTLRNSTLEDRVSQLDGALKECLRQLRQTREEKDEKFEQILEKKTSEWQKTKTQLENQLSDLHSQLQSAKKIESFSTSIEMMEKENSGLKLELASMAEELEIRFIERELSNQAAEQASKLHLESAKKAAKFEAECRKLNAALKKALANNEQRSIVEETSPKMDINLMDDFLEMERLAALPKNGPKDSLQNRMNEVEELLKRVESEKTNLEIALNERENELKSSRNKIKDSETKLVKMEALLTNTCDAREKTEKELESMKEKVNGLQESLKRSELEGLELKIQLKNESNERKEADSRFKDAYNNKNEAELRLKTLEFLIPKVDSLEKEVEKERVLSTKMGDKCRELEGELESWIFKVNSLETEVEKERVLSNKMGDKCRELEGELESWIFKVNSLESEVEKERVLSKKLGAKCRDLEGDISRLQLENQNPKPEIRNTELRIKQDKELALAGSKFADCQKTIASLSRQLKTLATLEDFLIDTNEFNKRA